MSLALPPRWLLGPTFGILVSVGGAGAVPPAAPTSVQVVGRTESAALLRWAPGAGETRGFKIRKSEVAGVHPDPTTFPGGKLAAFTWTTDDGYDDNLSYAPIFESRGLHYTIFVISSTVGTAGHLTWPDLATLHQQGHEIANHTAHHRTLIDDRAIALRYVGAEACSLVVKGDSLKTWVGGTADLQLSLTSAPVYFLARLAAFLDAEPDYEATLLYAADTIPATSSSFLDPVSGLQIGAGAPAETLTTERGVHDDAEMRAEILGCQNELEAHLRLIDTSYRCRTLGYPNHGHDQWSISTLNDLGYLGARAGPQGSWPFYSQGALTAGFTTTYEVPHGYPRPSNAWTESQTRTTFQSRIATWKQNREWTVLMSHHEGEVDVQHLEWTIDTIAADGQVWIARFDEVMSYLEDFYVDPGFPVGADGHGSAWLNGLNPATSYYVVITAYNDGLEESSWSQEIVVPAFAPATAAADVRPTPLGAARAVPNPFSTSTSIEFSARSPGVGRVEIWDLAGRRVRSLDLGWVAAGPNRVAWDGRSETREPAAAGVYWYRIRTGPDAQGGRVLLVR